MHHKNLVGLYLPSILIFSLTSTSILKKIRSNIELTCQLSLNYSSLMVSLIKQLSGNTVAATIKKNFSHEPN